MKFKTKIFILIGLLILAILFSFTWGFNMAKKRIPYPEVIHKTDTVYIHEPYVPDILPKDTIKPNTLTIWKVDSSQLNEYKLRIIQDSIRYSIMIQGLRDSIMISEVFLKTYPRNPKLLGLQLYRDSMNLITMSIEGVTSTEKYNLFLQDYNYIWNNQGLGYTKTKYRDKRVKPFSHYLGVQYDFLDKEFLPTYQIRFNFKKLELNLSASQELMFNENPQLRIGINYKLNK